MAADVSTGNNSKQQENEAKKKKKVELFTRDLLGGAACVSAGDQMEATVEWEKKFDLLLGQRSRASGKTFRPINLNFPPPPPPSFSSVCTLEKVKSALDRANGRKSNGGSASSASSSSCIKRSADDHESEKGKTTSDGTHEEDGKTVGTGPMMISRCPKCMQYLLVFKVDPRCPRCDAHVPEPNYIFDHIINTRKKKAKIILFDLNESAVITD